jgi:Flp pilus assembly protein TadG
MPARVRPPWGFRHRRGEAGQSLVEFAMVLMPLMLVLLGILQFGFVFNTYVTITNAAREAAREGTIYVYDRTLTKAQNDTARNERMRTTLLSSVNYLSAGSPHLTSSSTWTQSGTTFTTGDVTVTYTIPASITDSDPRTGEQITFEVRYHQDLIIPLISQFLPRDGNGRLILTGQVTMVIN